MTGRRRCASLARKFELADNDDRRISADYWYYQILRRMGDERQAAAFLKTVPEKPDLIENETYWRALRLDKGEITEAEAMKDGAKDPAGIAVAYGVANYHLDQRRQGRRFPAHERDGR